MLIACGTLGPTMLVSSLFGKSIETHDAVKFARTHALHHCGVTASLLAVMEPSPMDETWAGTGVEGGHGVL